MELREGAAKPCWQNKGALAEASWAKPQDLVMQIGDNVQDFPGITQKAAAALPQVVAEHLGRDCFCCPIRLMGLVGG